MLGLRLGVTEKSSLCGAEHILKYPPELPDWEQKACYVRPRTEEISLSQG
jgi:hypothetical protein